MKPSLSDAHASPPDQFTTDAQGSGSRKGPRTPGAPGVPLWSMLRRGLRQGRAALSGSVWLLVALKMAGSGLFLLFVAYLGHLSQRLEDYGPVRWVDDRVGILLEKAHGGSPDPVEFDGADPASARAPGPPQPAVETSDGHAAPKMLAQVAPKVAPPPCSETPEARLPGILPDGRVILNEANLEELVTLPGVGPARARAILDLRDRLQGFRRIADLLRVRGIGYKSLQKLKERVVVDRPAPVIPEADANSARSTAPTPPGEPRGEARARPSSAAELRRTIDHSSNRSADSSIDSSTERDGAGSGAGTPLVAQMTRGL